MKNILRPLNYKCGLWCGVLTHNYLVTNKQKLNITMDPTLYWICVVLGIVFGSVFVLTICAAITVKIQNCLEAKKIKANPGGEETQGSS